MEVPPDGRAAAARRARGAPAVASVADKLLQEKDRGNVEPETGCDGLRKSAGKAARGAAAKGMEANRISQVGFATRLA